MIGSQDTWVLMPTVDLYDTLMMLAAVNAARDMYNRNEQRIKEFNEKYGDFTTPIIADQDWYNREMLGKVYDTINDIYAQGGDPLRNSQDRLRMSMMLNKLPYGEYARKKLRSENAKEWFKNMAILNAKGKYDKDFSNFLGENPNQWALNDPGTTSPTEFQTLKEATNEWYNNRTPRSATVEEKQRLGLDPNYDYTLFTDDDLMNIARDLTPGWNNSAISKYYRNLALKQVASRGIPYTQQDVERQLLRNIASAQQEWKVDPIKGHADEFALDDHRTANDINATWAKEAARSYYDILQYADENGDGKLSSEERKKYAASTIGGTKNRRVPNIFREAEALTQDLKGNPGQLVLYELPEQYHQYIDPVVQADQRILKDKNTGDTRIGYVYSGESIGKHGTMWVLGQDGKFHYTRIKSPSKGQYTFIPGGSMRSLYIGTDKNGNKLYRYFISGQFRTPSGNFVHNDDGTDTQWVEVKERAHNYGQTLKKQ